MYGIIDFQTNLGSALMIRTVQVKPKDHAIIKCIFSEQDGDDTKHKILMEGNDYKLWGENDDYLGHFCIKKITGGTETIVGSDYVAPPRIESAPANDDNRSVHNDTDIQRITLLETELEEQRKKLAQIIGLLGKTTI